MVKAPTTKWLSPRERIRVGAVVRAHLAEHPDATVEELAKLAGCSMHVIVDLRATWAHRAAIAKARAE